MEVLSAFSEQCEDVRKHYGITKTEIDRDIRILKQWIKQQAHIPKLILEDDMVLESFLLKNKFRIERAKEKIENYCTLRRKYTNFLEYFTSIVPSQEPSFLLPLMPLTADLNRIIIGRIYNQDMFNFDKFVAVAMLMSEVSLYCDYSIGTKVILDSQGTSAEMLGKIDFTLFGATLNLYLKAYCGRMTQIHIINAASYMNVLLTMIKAVIPAKIFNRIKLHNNLQSLRESLCYDMLPCDYGGNGQNLKEQIAFFDDIFKKRQDIFVNAIKCMSNEELRIGGQISFGTSGTFKKLDID